MDEIKPAAKAAPPAKKKAPPRSQWTIKGEAISTELRNAVKLAAKKKRQRQADYVAQVLWKAAQADLKGGSEPEQANPPARIVDELSERMDKLTEQVAQLAARKTPAERAVNAITEWVFGPNR